MKILGRDSVLHLQQDSYYKDRSGTRPSARDSLNYDELGAVDMPLFVEQLSALLAGKSIRVPVYDYRQHIRTGKVVATEPKPIIVVEGVLVLAIDEIRELMDVKVFVNADSDLRLARRLKRDSTQRGRTTLSIMNQWNSTVQPMHSIYVDPSKKYADIIVDGTRSSRAASIVVQRIREHQRLKSEAINLS